MRRQDLDPRQNQAGLDEEFLIHLALRGYVAPCMLAFAVGGLIILWVERSCIRADVDSVDDIPWKRALGVGFFQVLAVLFPGASRSGATIIGGMVLGLSRTAATEFSFFMAIPAMLGASVIKLWKVRDLVTAADIPFFGVGFAVAFVSAALVIRGLIRYVSRRSFAPFACLLMPPAADFPLSLHRSCNPGICRG